MDDYRNGRFEEAVDRLEWGDAWTRAAIPFFHAMAHKQLGHMQAARRKLHEGVAVIWDKGIAVDGPQPSHYLPAGWLVWCFVEVIRREAEATVGGTNFRYLDAARNLIAEDDLTGAIEVFSQAIELDPTDAFALHGRSDLLIRMGKWQEAAADYCRVAELLPDDSLVWLKAAPLLILAGDREKYRQHCREMLRLFKDKDAGHSGKAIQCCLFLPDLFDNSEVPLAAFEQEVSGMPVPGFRACTIALAALRSGDTSKAIAWLNKARTTPTYDQNPQLQARVLPLEAMALHYAGKREEAEMAFQQADKLISEFLSELPDGRLGNNWHDWLIAEILRREASALLQEAVKGTSAQMEDKHMTELE
jgi:Flp pilus assembly protein TadD